MRIKRRHGLPKRRQREGKTNYRKRLQMITSRTPRLVIRKSLRNIAVQLIEYQPKGDRIVVSTTTKELEKAYGWKQARRNTPAAYLAGYLLGKKAQKKNIKKAVCDIGLQSITKGSILFSCLKGAVDAGLDIPHSDELMPSQDRLQGKHLKHPVSFQEMKAKIDAIVKK